MYKSAPSLLKSATESYNPEYHSQSSLDKEIIRNMDSCLIMTIYTRNNIRKGRILLFIIYRILIFRFILDAEDPIMAELHTLSHSVFQSATMEINKKKNLKLKKKKKMLMKIIKIVKPQTDLVE